MDWKASLERPDLPRWVAWSLRACVPDSPTRDTMLSDLLEEYRVAPGRARGRSLSIGLRNLPRRLKGPAHVHDEPRGDPAMASVMQDLRLALRLLRRTPAFTIVV